MTERTPAEHELPPGTMRLLHEAFQVLRRREQDYLAERGYEGVTLTHARVVQHVVYTGGSLSEIARRSEISRQAVAKVARDLEEMGFVALAPSAEDRRAYEARLTAEGKKLFGVLRRSIDRSEAALARSLGAGKLAGLRETLERIGRM